MAAPLILYLAFGFIVKHLD